MEIFHCRAANWPSLEFGCIKLAIVVNVVRTVVRLHCGPAVNKQLVAGVTLPVGLCDSWHRLHLNPQKKDPEFRKTQVFKISQCGINFPCDFMTRKKKLRPVTPTS